MRHSLVVCVLFLFIQPLQADDIDSRAVEKAKSFLKTSKRGEFVNGFVHFGTKYLGHGYAKTLTVKDGTGNILAGHFALAYDFDWTDGGKTQLAFLCDAKGNVYKVQVMACNGVFQQPYALANLSIQIVGEALYDALKEKLSEGDRKLVRKLIDDVDAQGLMQFGLRVQQANE